VNPSVNKTAREKESATPSRANKDAKRASNVAGRDRAQRAQRRIELDRAIADIVPGPQPPSDESESKWSKRSVASRGAAMTIQRLTSFDDALEDTRDSSTQRRAFALAIARKSFQHLYRKAPGKLGERLGAAIG